MEVLDSSDGSASSRDENEKTGEVLVIRFDARPQNLQTIIERRLPARYGRLLAPSVFPYFTGRSGGIVHADQFHTLQSGKEVLAL